MTTTAATTSVYDAAEYILTQTGEISTMKLQKLLYFAQAWHLAILGRPLFDEEFEAWASGPVCREIFELHKGAYEVGPGFIYAKLQALQEQRANGLDAPAAASSTVVDTPAVPEQVEAVEQPATKRRPWAAWKLWKPW